MSDISKERIEKITSEIVRGMNPSQLTEDQKTRLKHVSRSVMLNYLVYKKEKVELTSEMFNDIISRYKPEYVDINTYSLEDHIKIELGLE